MFVIGGVQLKVDSLEQGSTVVKSVNLSATMPPNSALKEAIVCACGSSICVLRARIGGLEVGI